MGPWESPRAQGGRGEDPYHVKSALYLTSEKESRIAYPAGDNGQLLGGAHVPGLESWTPQVSGPPSLRPQPGTTGFQISLLRSRTPQSPTLTRYVFSVSRFTSSGPRDMAAASGRASAGGRGGASWPPDCGRRENLGLATEPPSGVGCRHSCQPERTSVRLRCQNVKTLRRFTL